MQKLDNEEYALVDGQSTVAIIDEYNLIFCTDKWAYFSKNKGYYKSKIRIDEGGLFIKMKNKKTYISKAKKNYKSAEEELSHIFGYKTIMKSDKHKFIIVKKIDDNMIWIVCESLFADIPRVFGLTEHNGRKCFWMEGNRYYIDDFYPC